MNAPVAAPPLEGLVVLDLSRVLAGPWCTQTLADLGATVWKVEPPGGGDDTRNWLAAALDGESTYFMSANRSKQSLAIDLKTPEGAQLVRDLALRADVFIENFRAGAMERFGLGPEALAAINPRLVYCSISGYGRTGARRDEAGYDFAIQAESGLMAVTGDPDGEPMKYGVAITDIATGMNATQAILAALLVREKTGRGQFIDLALLDTAITLLVNLGQGSLATGAAPGRYGNAHATIVPYQTFRGQDGVFVLALGNDRQFATLCEAVLGVPEIAADPRFASNPERVRNRAILVPMLAAIFARAPVAEWLARLRRHGLPTGAVREVLDVVNGADARERGIVTVVDDPVHGPLRMFASPLRLTDTPPVPPRPAPRLGEHTESVLRSALDLAPSEIARLRDHGVIG